MDITEKYDIPENRLGTCDFGLSYEMLLWFNRKNAKTRQKYTIMIMMLCGVLSVIYLIYGFVNGVEYLVEIGWLMLFVFLLFIVRIYGIRKMHEKSARAYMNKRDNSKVSLTFYKDFLISKSHSDIHSTSHKLDYNEVTFIIMGKEYCAFVFGRMNLYVCFTRENINGFNLFELIEEIRERIPTIKYLVDYK